MELKKKDVASVSGEASVGVVKLLYSRKEAAYALSVSARSLDYLIEGGHIQTRRIGSRVLIPREEVQRIAENGIDGSVLDSAAA